MARRADGGAVAVAVAVACYVVSSSAASSASSIKPPALPGDAVSSVRCHGLTKSGHDNPPQTPCLPPLPFQPFPLLRGKWPRGPMGVPLQLPLFLKPPALPGDRLPPLLHPQLRLPPSTPFFNIPGQCPGLQQQNTMPDTTHKLVCTCCRCRFTPLPRRERMSPAKPETGEGAARQNRSASPV